MIKLVFLEELKGRLSEEEAKKYFRQIVEVLEYCQGKNIVHRDLKPENILLTLEDDIKISDFGLSSIKNYSDTQLIDTICGTLHYLAPEIIKNSNGYDGHLSDIWSTGIILYNMITGTLPFDDDNVSSLINKIILAQINFPDYVSEEAKNLISKILVPHPLKRLKLNEIKESPWLDTHLTQLDIKEIKVNEDTPLLMLKPAKLTWLEIMALCSGNTFSNIYNSNKHGSNKDEELIIEKKSEHFTENIILIVKKCGGYVINLHLQNKILVTFKNKENDSKLLECKMWIFLYEIGEDRYYILCKKESGNIQIYEQYVTLLMSELKKL